MVDGPSSCLGGEGRPHTKTIVYRLHLQQSLPAFAPKWPAPATGSRITMRSNQWPNRDPSVRAVLLAACGQTCEKRYRKALERRPSIPPCNLQSTVKVEIVSTRERGCGVEQIKSKQEHVSLKTGLDRRCGSSRSKRDGVGAARIIACHSHSPTPSRTQAPAASSATSVWVSS